MARWTDRSAVWWTAGDSEVAHTDARSFPLVHRGLKQTLPALSSAGRLDYVTRQSRRRRSADGPRRTDAGTLDRSRLRLLGVALICAKVALVPLIFDASLDLPFVVPKALFSHGLAYVLAAIMAALAVQFGTELFVRSWIHVPVLAFLMSNAVSAGLAADPTLALYGTHARMLGLGTTLDMVVLYFAVTVLVRTRREAFAVGIAVLAASAVVLGYEVIQMTGRDPFPWSIDSAARPFSTFGHGTVLGQYLTVVALGALTTGLLVDGLSVRVRIVLVGYSILLLIGSAVTQTRSTAVGLGVGGVLLVLLLVRLRPNPRARLLTVLGACSVAAALALLLLGTPLGTRLASTIEAPTDGDDAFVSRLEPSVAARVNLYEIGLNMVRERPLFGYGPDNFVVGVPRYRPDRSVDFIQQSLATSAHSWAVHVATSSGLVGLACFMAIVLVALGWALRSLRPAALPAAVMLVAFLGTGLTTVNEIGTEWLFWFSVAAVAASTGQSMGSSGPGESLTNLTTRRRPVPNLGVKRMAIFALILIGVLLALNGVTALDASRSARGSQQSRLAGQPRMAIELAERATRSDPGRSEYWHASGLAYVAARRWPDAIAALDRATRLAPYDARYVGDLAAAELILATAGDSSARVRARELGERAVQIDRNNPRAHLTRAVVMQVLGDLPEALRSVQRALALDAKSTNPSLYVTAAQVMRESGLVNEAARVARNGLDVFGLAPRTMPIRIELARALVAAGRPLEAVVELDIALGIHPNHETATRLRSEIRASLTD
jgi:putative inorganic carbon (HCO3(-)) transporter